MEKIGDYEIHEMASRLPMMPDDQYECLKENIKEQGLLEPIIISSEKEPIIIDGKNRLKACNELGYKPDFITLEKFLKMSGYNRSNMTGGNTEGGLTEAEGSGDEDKIIKEVVLMKNVLRRHLSDFQKFLQLKAVEGYPEHGTNRYTDSREADSASLESVSCSLADLAKKLGWSERKIKQAQWLDKNAPKDIQQALMKGELSVNGAYVEEKKKRQSRPNWFDQNIEDEKERFAVKTAVRFGKQIEKEFGIGHKKEILDIMMKVNHLNYKETWNQE